MEGAGEGATSSGDLQQPDVKKQVEELWEEVARKANDHFRNSMPRRIIKLSELLASEEFNRRPGQVGQTPGPRMQAGAEKEVREGQDDGEPPQKRARAEKANVPSNKAFTRMVELIKQEVIEGIAIFNSIKLWIQLSIPRIEAGSSFGVDVQTDIISELSRAEDAGYSLLEGITKYYVTRAKLVSKTLKYPNIEDYDYSVRELDEKEYINMKLSTLDLRNNMAVIYDLLSKNWDRIQKPITSHHMTMF